jgi:hypothetical protein
VLNDEIDREFTVDLPAGRHRVEIAHTGTDWVNLKSVRLERVLPAPFAGGWQFAAEAIGLRHGDTAVIYVRSPHVAWPAGALRYNPPIIQGATVTLTAWSPGTSQVVWIDPKTGRELAAVAVTGHETRTLTVPDFAEDAVAIVKNQAPGQ